MKLRYLSLSAEQAPWSRSGGLAEVAGSLPSALAQLWQRSEVYDEVSVTCLSPLYPCVWREVALRGDRLEPGPMLSLSPLSESRAQVWMLHSSSNDHSRQGHLFIDIPWAFDREYLYGPPGGSYQDNPLRFACFCFAVIKWLNELDEDNTETVIHCHDWQASFLPIYLRYSVRRGKVKTLFTIHNLMHQGLCDAEWIPKLGFDWADFHMNFMEHWGQLNPIKAALSSVDMVTTVSPSYAEEILTAPFACGLESFFSANRLKVNGILNGLDLESWSPYRSPHLSAHLPIGLGDEALDEALDHWKAINKQQVSPSLYPRDQVENSPLAVLISRFDHQKGIELLIEAAEQWLSGGGRLFILGSGSPILEAEVSALAARHPQGCEVKIGFDLALAHRLFAAADLCLIPSRFEPCGLTQMQAMRYGVLPLATPVGGLRDSIQPINLSSGAASLEKGNGFICKDVSVDSLSHALHEALALWSQSLEWRAARKRALKTDWSWSQSAQSWQALIEAL